MIQDEDYLLRQIRAVIETIAALIRGEGEAAELDAEIQRGFGLNLATLDLLSAPSLAQVMRTPGDPRGAERLRGVAELLEALAGQAPGSALAAQRRRKAAQLRAILAQPGGGDPPPEAGL